MPVWICKKAEAVHRSYHSLSIQNMKHERKRVVLQILVQIKCPEKNLSVSHIFPESKKNWNTKSPTFECGRMWVCEGFWVWRKMRGDLASAIWLSYTKGYIKWWLQIAARAQVRIVLQTDRRHEFFSSKARSIYWGKNCILGWTKCIPLVMLGKVLRSLFKNGRFCNA